MIHCQSPTDRRYGKLSRSEFTRFGIITVLLAAFWLPGTAGAQTARARDTINGDPVTPLQWSEGTWLQGNSPIPGCTTFSGGTSTGPGGFAYVDSVTCSPPPNRWQWTVTLPGPFTLQYDIFGFPPGVTVCGQVFGSASMSGIRADVDLVEDWMECWNMDTGGLIWEGEFSTFDPEYAGFLVYAAQRCGVYRLLPPGACCNLTTGECVILTAEECEQQAYPHVYMGDNTVCSPNPCPQPYGACCRPDGSCVLTTQADCPSPPYQWYGPGSVCDPNPCPQPLGACCHPDASCELTTEADCPSPPNQWYGPGSVCDPSPCPPPLGACCRPDGTCFISTQTDCVSPNQWYGAGSVCDPTPCPPPVPTEKHSWGRVKAHYR